MAAKKTKRVNNAPLSEDQRKFHEDWTSEDCIAELQRIAKLDETKVVSRNYFRVHSQISESTWNRFFGTFSEFKRQAGIVLSRQQHGLERAIAKHASVDHYREYNVEREGAGAKYNRPKDGRFKTAIICSDLHDEEIDPFYLRVLLDSAARIQPNLFVFGGDTLDLAEFGKYTVDPRTWNPVSKIKFVHDKILRPLRTAIPEAQIDFIEGNHEYRMVKLLADATPALRAILSDLHGMTMSKFFGLDEFEMNYVAKADLAAYTERDALNELKNNYRIYWDNLLVHHFPQGRNFNMPGVNGHHHQHQVWPSFNPMFGAYEWHQLGSGHRRSASYCEGERWHCGFIIANIDTKTRACNFDYVQVTDHAVVGGKWYTRDPGEIVNRSVLLMK